MLAEDSAVNQKLATVLLELQGHAVSLANNGREALEKLQQQPFDLVLMDVQMPELDGLEATRQIRAREPAEEHIPIVAMTAHAMQGDRERCLDVGMDDYLSKPVRAQELREVLERLFASPAEDDRPRDVDEAHSDKAEERVADDHLTIDWSEALAGVGNKADLLRELVDLFLKEAPRLLRQAEEAIEKADPPELRLAAHTLKGSARYFGKSSLSVLAAELETMATQRQLGDAPRCLAEIQEVFARMLPQFHDFRDRK